MNNYKTATKKLKEKFHIKHKTPTNQLQKNLKIDLKFAT
jgi:hypothetical protein